GLIRGHAGTIVMVEHGMFERYTPYISVKPEKSRKNYIDPSWPERFGTQDEVKIDIPQEDIMQKHIGNFLDCMRSREKPVLDVETGARAQVLITMSVMAYRQGRVLYFNESNWQVTDTPPGLTNGLTTSRPAAPAKA
ncbi:MAG TPA: hypothetical protein VG345_09365, partial [Bryobacteraceae bacterium]|nr:hypothetical protein [Bryobacteraceae bacterium]